MQSILKILSPPPYIFYSIFDLENIYYIMIDIFDRLNLWNIINNHLGAPYYNSLTKN